MCGVLYKHRAETLLLSPSTLQALSMATDCRKMKTDAKAMCKATGRHCSGQQEEVLAHHGAHHILIDLQPLALKDLLLTLLTDHSDLHGNKYIFNLSRN